MILGLRSKGPVRVKHVILLSQSMSLEETASIGLVKHE